MLVVNKYKDVLIEHYYLDEDGVTIRYRKDGYRGRYKAGEAVSQFKMNKHGILGIHIPKHRATVPVAHLIVMFHGIDIPDNEVVDHIDGNILNNHISNLRVVSQEINCRNRRKPNKTTKTGEVGIVKNKSSYIVRLHLNGIRHYVGSYATLDEAINARDQYDMQRKADGYTSRHFK